MVGEGHKRPKTVKKNHYGRSIKKPHLTAEVSVTAIPESVVPAERRRRIVDYLQINRSGRNEELAAALRVSLATVRRDLDQLATEGLVSRTHGGAVLPGRSTSYERLYSDKRNLFAAEKQRIGAAAAAMVADGDTLILDSGSTTIEVARQLAGHKNLTIITNDLLIGSAVEFDPTTTLLLTGGTRRSGFSVLVGPVAEEFLRRVRVNKSFLSADAVDVEYGITNATFPEAATKQLIIEAAAEVILVADHSKFGASALVKVAGLEVVHHVVTDSQIDPDALQAIRRRGLPFTIV